MEPMTLDGITPSSPSSPVNAGFLPSFLIMDNNPFSVQSRRFSADSRNFYENFLSETESPQTGPPNQGLFDTIERKKSPNQSDYRSFNCSKNVNDLDGNEEEDSLWVTVFGFPPNALSLVLAHVNTCGVILDKRAPTQGNWVHVKFNNSRDVSKALALNGRCINNCMMIGVMLCDNKENKENERISLTPGKGRPLRHSYRSSGNKSWVNPENVPQKSTDMVSKTIDYVFGW